MSNSNIYWHQPILKVLITDDRIGCITYTIKCGVLKGGQNVTSQTFNGMPKSTSAHVFNVAVPSLETIISREALGHVI